MKNFKEVGREDVLAFHDFLVSMGLNARDDDIQSVVSDWSVSPGFDPEELYEKYMNWILKA